MTLVALVGNPNSGKTALFNALTGLNRKVANFPGVTVESFRAPLIKKFGSHFGGRVDILDLPGTYSLTPTSPDEAVTVSVLMQNNSEAGKQTIPEMPTPEALIFVVDSCNLKLHLMFLLQVKELGYPIVLALNMSDLAAKQDIQIDFIKLEQELGMSVVPIIATQNTGLPALIEQVHKAISTPRSLRSQSLDSVNLTLKQRYIEVTRILDICVGTSARSDSASHKIDKYLLHPFFGPAILVFVLFLIFQFLFTWSAPFMDVIEASVEALKAFVIANASAGLLTDLLTDGVISGVGSVLVFLPQILFLTLFILLLEDSGYMSRAAVLLDKPMSKVGLSGKSALPLLSGFACSIPSMVASRVIGNRRQKFSTIFLAPLMTCSARLPVYTILIAAFIPATKLWGFVSYQALVLLLLYFAGVVSAFLIALIANGIKKSSSSFMLELPSYKVPNLKSVFRGLIDRCSGFLKKAGTFILCINIVLWVLCTFPKVAPTDGTLPITHTIAGILGRWIQPVLSPLGFDWHVAIAMVPGFGAREVLVGALGTVYAVETKDGTDSLAHILSSQWSFASAMALLAWYVFAPQCLATYAVMQRETKSWTLTLSNFALYLGLAWVAAFVTYRVAS